MRSDRRSRYHRIAHRSVRARRPYCAAADRGTQRTRSVADVAAQMAGTVWSVGCRVGQKVGEGDTVVVLEAMTMEMPMEAARDGTVVEIRCAKGQPVREGDVLVVIK